MCWIRKDLVLFQAFFVFFFICILIWVRLLIYNFALIFVGFGSGDRGMMSMAGGMAQAMLSKPGGNLS